MLLSCDKLGKRYNRHWVFRELSRDFKPGDKIAIIGNNGSGKSTLLKILAGFERFSEGNYTVSVNGKTVDENNVYRHISLCAPYQGLYEDLTLEEHFDLHRSFKNMRVNGFEEFKAILVLDNVYNKPLKNYSSGMRQRVKLALAILSDTPFLFLDEPVSNLDARSTQWYRDLVTSHLENRIVFVASNRNDDELFFCTEHIQIEDFLSKPKP